MGKCWIRCGLSIYIVDKSVVEGEKLVFAGFLRLFLWDFWIFFLRRAGKGDIMV